MIVHEGLIGAFNYAIGPALIYESVATLNLIHTSGDPFIVIVPDTIPLKPLFSTDSRRVRGFVLAHCEKDSVFTGFVITQRRAAVRCVPGILDDIKEGRLKNGDLIAVDGVNGKVYVQPDAETIARFEALRDTPQPEVTKEYLPRLAREAMQTANVPEIPPLPPAPDMPEMLMQDKWPGMDGAGSHLPSDMPTPPEIKREIEIVLGASKSAYETAKLKTWQTVALVHVSLFRDKPLEPDELEVLNNAVAEEIARLEALKPPPPPRPKTREEKWGLTPLTEEERKQLAAPAEEGPRRGASRRGRAATAGEAEETDREAIEVAAKTEKTRAQEAEEPPPPFLET